MCLDLCVNQISQTIAMHLWLSSQLMVGLPWIVSTPSIEWRIYLLLFKNQYIHMVSVLRTLPPLDFCTVIFHEIVLS